MIAIKKPRRLLRLIVPFGMTLAIALGAWQCSRPTARDEKNYQKFLEQTPSFIREQAPLIMSTRAFSDRIDGTTDQCAVQIYDISGLNLSSIIAGLRPAPLSKEADPEPEPGNWYVVDTSDMTGFGRGLYRLPSVSMSQDGYFCGMSEEAFRTLTAELDSIRITEGTLLFGFRERYSVDPMAPRAQIVFHRMIDANRKRYYSRFRVFPTID